MTVAVLEREVDLASMRVLQKPGTLRLLLRSELVDRFLHPPVHRGPYGAEVFERSQHVIVPAGWKREPQPGRVDDIARALAPEQLSFEKVLLAPAPRRDGFRGATPCALIRQQSFEDVDRRRERGAEGSILRLAVPAAVLELLLQEA